jgi:hypothetical protein
MDLYWMILSNMLPKVTKHDAKEILPDDVENVVEGTCRLNETEVCLIIMTIVNPRKKNQR